jgi:hypothetical protein
MSGMRRRLLLDAHRCQEPSLRSTNSSIEYDAVTNPYCSRRSDHGVDTCARELAEIADLHPVVANECPKDVRILRETVLSKRRHHTAGIK